jgi:hypothetical protein
VHDVNVVVAADVGVLAHVDDDDGRREVTVGEDELWTRCYKLVLAGDMYISVAIFMT